LRPAWTRSSHLHCLHSWDDRCVPPCLVFIGEIGSHELFAQAGLDLPDLHFPRS
jgi:hypothetical protein